MLGQGGDGAGEETEVGEHSKAQIMMAWYLMLRSWGRLSFLPFLFCF